MKKITKNLSKLTKILLVLLMLTSHFMLPIQVLADELDEEQLEPMQQEQQELEQPLEDEQQETSIEELSLLKTLDEDLDGDNLDEQSLTNINEDETNLEGDENLDNGEQDENVDSENAKYNIYINDVELIGDNFDITTDLPKLIKIKNEYTKTGEFIYNPTEVMDIDFTNRLYGVYSYELSVSNQEEIIEKREVTISHLGNNNEIINTNNIYYLNNTYYILSDTTNPLTVEDVIGKFNPNLINYNAVLEVYDLEDN